MTRKLTSGRAYSIPAGVCMGTVIALILTLVGTGITAKIVELQILDQRHIGYAVILFLLTSTYFGAMISYQKIKRRKLMTCLLSAGSYEAILLIITGLLFGGKYSGMWDTTLVILCGSILPMFANTRENIKNKRRKRKRFNG